MSARSGYETPALAAIHDKGFGFHARAAAAELLERLRRRGLESGLVVDLGCGTGILSQIVSDEGYAVLGIDRSAEMLKLARRNAPKATFRRASFVDAELPPCIAVTAVGEVLGYAFDARAGTALSVLFRRVHGALARGGVFLFDVAGPGRVPARGIDRAFWDDDWAIFSSNREDAAAQTLTRRMVFFERDGRLYRRGEEEHVLNLHEPQAVVTALRGAGFRVRRLRRYADFGLPRGLHGFLATKPG